MSKGSRFRTRPQPAANLSGYAQQLALLETNRTRVHIAPNTQSTRRDNGTPGHFCSATTCKQG